MDGSTGTITPAMPTPRRTRLNTAALLLLVDQVRENLRELEEIDLALWSLPE